MFLSILSNFIAIALEYLQRSLKIYEELPGKHGIAATLIHL